MATITYFNGLGTNGPVLTEIDWAHLTLNGFGNTATLTDPNGRKIVMLGTGMAYDTVGGVSVVTGGTVTSLTL
jgi:hypothetical protein